MIEPHMIYEFYDSNEECYLWDFKSSEHCGYFLKHEREIIKDDKRTFGEFIFTTDLSQGTKVIGAFEGSFIIPVNCFDAAEVFARFVYPRPPTDDAAKWLTLLGVDPGNHA